MKQIIKDGLIVENAWQDWTESGAAVSDIIGGRRQVIVPLQFLEEHAHQLAAPALCTGVLLMPDEAPERLLPYLGKLSLIAVHFPSFADGRGYSSGQLLRTRHGFAGELRAVGDILRDQLYFLSRCGFNAFELREDQDLQAALAAFTDYAWQPNSRLYQEAGSRAE